jgi:hypothetical protein
MRTYDPAAGIRYVHLASEAGLETGRPLRPDCTRLPAGYANDSPLTRLPAAPVLVVLPGGAEPAPAAAAAPALRLA